MSMKTMKENKRTIAELRENNKSLRKDLSHIQREAGRAAKLGAITEEENELAKLEREISRMRRNHDTLKNAVDKKRGELKRLRDKARDLELESTKPNEENSPLTQKIRVLENRLDKAMIKYNEAQSIRRTYEQIVKRLKDERVGFDNQLAAIERTLQAKQHDYEELLLLSGDANHAKDVAIQEVERMRTTLSENRRTRERDLREKKDLVNLRHDMASRMENMEKMRQDLIAKAAGDLSEKEEKNLKKTLVLNKITQQKITEENNKKQDMIDVFEIAFRKIKDATGVSDVNEVIQKIISQEDTQNNLVELTKENQNKIESLQSEKQRLKARVEEIKYSGHGGGHRRKVVDEHEEKITLALASMDRAKTKFERLARILINVKAGIEHLSEKLDNVKDDGKQIVLTDDTIADVLYQCESTLTSLLQNFVHKTLMQTEERTKTLQAYLRSVLVMLKSCRVDLLISASSYRQCPSLMAQRKNLKETLAWKMSLMETMKRNLPASGLKKRLKACSECTIKKPSVNRRKKHFRKALNANVQVKEARRKLRWFKTYMFCCMRPRIKN